MRKAIVLTFDIGCLVEIRVQTLLNIVLPKTLNKPSFSWY